MLTGVLMDSAYLFAPPTLKDLNSNGEWFSYTLCQWETAEESIVVRQKRWWKLCLGQMLVGSKP